MNYKLFPCTAMPNHTIEGLIKLYNAHSMDRQLVKDLMKVFNQHNPLAQPPKAGQKVLIPVLFEYWGKHERNCESTK